MTVEAKACSKCKATKPVGEFTPRGDRAAGLSSACKACERERATGYVREYTPTRAVRNRARGRATQRLVKLHAAEFEALMAEEIEKARDEIAPTKAAAASKPQPARHEHAPAPQPSPASAVVVVAAPVAVPLLRPGPRPAGQTVADRVREDVGRCAVCVGSHDRRHVCPACGERGDAGWLRSANGGRP